MTVLWMVPHTLMVLITYTSRMMVLWMVPHALMVLLTCESMVPVPLIHQGDGTVDGALHPNGVTHPHLQGASTTCPPG